MSSAQRAAIGVLLFLTFAVEYVLATVLLSRLRRKHESVYQSMGSPRLVVGWEGAPIVPFVFTREHRTLGDPMLSVISDVMLFLSVVYLVVFLYAAAQLR